MGLRQGALLLLLLAACSRDKAGAPSDPSLTTAEAFCRAIFEAPKRQLEARCSADDQKQKEYGRLLATASRPVNACIAALEPSVKASRLKLHKAAAEACARALETAPWKSTLRTRELSGYPECKGLTTGVQAENALCRTSLDCQPDLWCSGASFESDGKCQKRGAERASCDAPLLFLFDEVNAPCSAEQACDFGPFRPAYALGYPPLLSVELEKELAKRRPLPGSLPTGKPSSALSDAAEFGMIGLIGASDAGARGEGIGLGSIGSIGSFGSGHGRLGSGATNAPRVRMGATSVNGRLPPEVIQRIVRQNFGRFRLCYENGLRENKKLEGRVTVRFQITRDGSVANVQGSGDLPDKSVVACVTKAFYGLSFPQPEGGIVSVTYPIMFSPGDSPADAGAPPATDAGDADASAPAEPKSPEITRMSEKDARSPLICTRRLARAVACSASHQCQSGMLCRAGHCEAPGKAGEVCESDIECQSGHFCGAVSDASGVRGSCQALGASGTPCTDSGQCRGACSADGKCISFCGQE